MAGGAGVLRPVGVADGADETVEGAMSDETMVFRALYRHGARVGVEVTAAPLRMRIASEMLGADFASIEGNLVTIVADNGSWVYRIGEPDDLGIHDAVRVS